MNQKTTEMRMDGYRTLIQNRNRPWLLFRQPGMSFVSTAADHMSRKELKILDAAR